MQALSQLSYTPYSFLFGFPLRQTHLTVFVSSLELYTEI
jgi:hypothetical protein